MDTWAIFGWNSLLLNNRLFASMRLYPWQGQRTNYWLLHVTMTWHWDHMLRRVGKPLTLRHQLHAVTSTKIPGGTAGATSLDPALYSLCTSPSVLLRTFKTWLMGHGQLGQGKVSENPAERELASWSWISQCQVGFTMHFVHFHPPFRLLRQSFDLITRCSQKNLLLSRHSIQSSHANDLRGSSSCTTFCEKTVANCASLLVPGVFNFFNVWREIRGENHDLISI